ncbi:non-ribosomal peptide synthetase [Pseudomonas arsenicoxydans]|uniref:Non-ribosomal peptide synthetase n=1 Tax=Pseudomonas arsenicoxydans TaxID=702115 RepID=A0A502GRC2_9PSED|nr:non-ribosomal peptide synthetase [Pseudomonas arsenicoxydans]
MLWSRLQHITTSRFINVYGPTECTVDATACPIDAALSQPSIGHPIANTQLYILDPQGQPVPIGVTGQIHIAGAGVARGYLNRPALTAERFVTNPFSPDPHARMYCTGDLGRWLNDGSIEYLGRNDFQVKIRGFRIELGEIEAALTQCPGVREAVVLARQDQSGDQRLIAYLLSEPGVELMPAQLRQHLTHHLAEYMLPSAFMTLDAFPLTPNGKLDRQALPMPDQSAVVTRGYEPPQGELEIRLADIWQELLGLERVGRHDHFFELGGHSLIAVRLLNRIREQGMGVPMAALFAHPILCDLALAVNERTIQPASAFEGALVPLSPTGSLLPLFLVHETSGDPLVYSTLAAMLPTELPVYALQALDIHSLEQPPTSIETLATRHIQAIRYLQPQGPYRLAGWSIGGTIAYEIAQQLISDGEEVTFLGMIDTYNNNKLADASRLDISGDIEVIISFLRNYMSITDEQIANKLRHLGDVGLVIDHCIERKWLPSNITREDIVLRLDTSKIVTQLGNAYIAPISHLPIHLYTAGATTDGPFWNGWHGIVAENSSLHAIGGTHHSIMRPPLLNQVVDSFVEYLLPMPDCNPHIIIQSGSRLNPPLFCVPGAGASASTFLELALSLPPSQPVHALEARGLTDGHLPPFSSVEGAASANIQAIRKIQAQGPYHLLGHSFGGWIAYEMTLQLQAQGERVAELILVDTDAPRPQRNSTKFINRIETLMQLIKIYDLMLEKPLPLTRQDFSNLDPDAQIHCLLRALIYAGLLPDNTQMSVLQGVVRVIQANLNTCYTPQTRYEGLVHLINAEEGYVDDRQIREATWKTHVASAITMVTPGNHMTMLIRPQVAQFAAWLERQLSRH